MGKIASIKAPANSGGDFEIAPEGVFLARCYKMVDVGTQTTTGQYGTKENRTIYLYWELLQDDDGQDVRMESGEPYGLFNSYTLSMNKKANLRKHVDAWRGKALTETEAEDFDLSKLLGQFCKIQVVHKESKDGSKTYANIGAIMSTKKKVDGVNELSSFSVDEPDMDVFNDLPEWLQTKIEESPEWQDAPEEDEQETAPAPKTENKATNEIPVDDVPF